MFVWREMEGGGRKEKKEDGGGGDGKCEEKEK